MKYFLTILYIFYMHYAFTQKEQINVLFVMDASSSMLKQWGQKDKWTIAEESLLKVADSLLREHPTIRLGIRAYGHQSLPIRSDCFDTQLRLPLKHNTIDDLKNTLIGIKPKGITPLSYTLEQTENDFKNLQGQKNIIVLITDGSESCIGNPCDVIETLLEYQVIVKPIVIGLDIDLESLKDYHCIKDVFNPNTPTELQKNIVKVVHRSINYSSLQVFLKDYTGKYEQTKLAMLFYEDKETDPLYTFYHHLDKYKKPDTLYLHPGPIYKLFIETKPPLAIPPFLLENNKHNTISVDAATSKLLIQSTYNNIAEKTIQPVPYLIKESNKNEYFYTGEVNTAEDFLFGNYQVDVLTIPITSYKNLKLNSKNTFLKIPIAGSLKIKAQFPVHASIYVQNEQTMINVYNFPTNTTQESIDLQPGDYKLVYRFDHEKEMEKSKIKSFKIQSKETLILNL